MLDSIGLVPKTGLGEINGDLPEEDFGPAVVGNPPWPVTSKLLVTLAPRVWSGSEYLGEANDDLHRCDSWSDAVFFVVQV